MTVHVTGNTTRSLVYNKTIISGHIYNNTLTNVTYRPGLGYYNISHFPTLSPSPIFVPTVVVSNDSSFYSYGYYYLILLAFLILAGVLVKIAAQRRQQAVRAVLSQRLQARQANTSVSTVSNGRLNSNGEGGNSSNTQPKDSDLPPAYDEVMQTYINAKLQLQAQEEGAVGGMSSAISSITIETEIDAIPSSADLTTTATTTTTTTTTTTLATVASTQPPTYESTELKNNSNSIV